MKELTLRDGEVLKCDFCNQEIVKLAWADTDGACIFIYCESCAPKDDK